MSDYMIGIKLVENTQSLKTNHIRESMMMFTIGVVTVIARKHSFPILTITTATLTTVLRTVLTITIHTGFKSSFQMTDESNYSIAFAPLSDWPKNLALVFRPMRGKSKTNRTLYARFYPRFEQVAGNCKEF